MKTLFERIISGELPSEKVLENEHVVAIKDIAPKAPVHLLIIPRKAIPDLQSMKQEDYYLLGEIVKAAQELANQFGLQEGGYRLVVNNGPDAGQTVFHLHFHLMGGMSMERMV